MLGVAGWTKWHIYIVHYWAPEVRDVGAVAAAGGVQHQGWHRLPSKGAYLICKKFIVLITMEYLEISYFNNQTFTNNNYTT